MMRARLYREIRRQTPRVSRDSWYEHTVSPSERLLPELIALRVYRSQRLKWVVLVAAGLDDYRRPLESGEVLHLPSLEWLRDRFRHYERMARVNVSPGPVQSLAKPASESPTLSLPASDQASETLRNALAALGEPTPLVSSADTIDDESLNRQRNAIEAKLQAIRDALAQLESSS